MKLFQWVKEIRSKDGVLHFKRFAIIETSIFAVYIHKIYEADKDPYMHSHPWNFFGIVLKGSYTEQYRHVESITIDKLWDLIPWTGAISIYNKTRIKTPFGFGFGSRKYYHKILTINNGPVTTLFFTFGKHTPWYYYIDNDMKRFRDHTQCVENSDYRKLKNEGKL